MSIFITASGTDVGKTIFSAMIMAKYAYHLNLIYWKPIQTGSHEASDIKKIIDLTNLPEEFFKNTDYHFLKSASPHYASKLENKEIDIELLEIQLHAIKNDKVIIEGVGGLFTPLTYKHLFIDSLRRLKIPTILVVSTILGTINHSLLSIEALKKREIPVLGFYMYGPPNNLLEDNIYSIESFGEIPFLGHSFIPKSIDSWGLFDEAVMNNFDPDERLLETLKNCL